MPRPSAPPTRICHQSMLVTNSCQLHGGLIPQGRRSSTFNHPYLIASSYDGAQPFAKNIHLRWTG